MVSPDSVSRRASPPPAPHSSPWRFVFRLSFGAAVLAVASVSAMEPVADIVAIYSETASDYQRTRLPDNTLKPETYTFGSGGRLDGPFRDKSIDNLPFIEIARTVSRPLAEAKYLPAERPEQTDLLIILSWGTTTGTRGMHGSTTLDSAASAMRNAASAAQIANTAQLETPEPGTDRANAAAAGNSALESALSQLALENSQREHENWRNARILGFSEDYERAIALKHMSFTRDTVEELESNRYFVVLQAYDFRSAWKEKKLKLRWVTRYSIRQDGNNFAQELARMTEKASEYFGQDTRGLLRRNLPQGKVDIGEMKVIDIAPPKKTP